jgi:hypothetical protein
LANLELLSNLCSYLADIANSADVNKMNVRNGKTRNHHIDIRKLTRISCDCLRPDS